MTAEREPMTSDDLVERLGVDKRQLAKWVKAGMPHSGRTRDRTFDLDAVETWLIANGHAVLDDAATSDHPVVSDQPQKIARTRAELARELGLGIDGERTVSKWLKLPGFPGKSGTPGKEDGYFPVEEIREFLAVYGGRRGASFDDEISRDKRILLGLEIRKAQLDARKELGEILEFAEVARFYEQCVTNCKAVLGQIPDDLLAVMPAELPELVRSQVHRQVQRRIDEALIEIAQLLEGDTDPMADEDEAEREETE